MGTLGGKGLKLNKFEIEANHQLWKTFKIAQLEKGR